MLPMRSVEPRSFASWSRLLSTVAILSLSATAVFGQSATPAVSTVVAFSASTPNGGIVRGPDGAYYGTTASASTVTGGLVFRVTPDGSSVSTLYQMQNNESYGPAAGLLLGSDGLLYGTTTFGAVSVVANTSGTVFRLKPDGTGFTVIRNFATWSTQNDSLSPINTEGAYPDATLIEGTDGFLYGVTRAGGPNGTGAVFKLAKDGTSFKVLHTFGAITSEKNATPVTNLDGIAPLGSLVQYSDGFLYGTTSSGGVNGQGTVFRVGMDGTGFQLVHIFPALSSSGSDPTNASGASPAAGLTDGKDGRLYGVAGEGGANGVGTLFVIDPAARLLTVLHNFANANGNGPTGALIVGRDSKLYGTTTFGGTNSNGNESNQGTIFSINRDGTGFTKLHSFDNSQGSNPRGPLLQISDTNFVGINLNGGSCGSGTLYLYSGNGATVEGNTRCGRKKNNNGGGGSTVPLVLLLLGGLGLARSLGRR
jgi:uncharacterized repeat protein (TIGR03803 family)